MSVRVLVGDAREMLRTLPDASVHMVCTSPPYFGLRDYGIEPTIWGGDPTHDIHEWGAVVRSAKQGGGGIAKSTLGPASGGHGMSTQAHLQSLERSRHEGGASRFCSCGAWLGCLGLEPTPELFIEHMVEVFREVRRVLRPDGTLWLNIGDSYATGTTAPRTHSPNSIVLGTGYADAQDAVPRVGTPAGMKAKDLMGIPWMLAFALRADGWYLRSDIIWSKPNPMPESVTDRPTKAHEYLFLLSKSRTYFYDADAIREAYQPTTLDRNAYSRQDIRSGVANAVRTVGEKFTKGDDIPLRADIVPNPAGRNKRSVWEIATEPFPEAHFATYPTALIEPCIKAGTSERGCCPECGAPWVRVTQSRKRELPDGWCECGKKHTQERRGDIAFVKGAQSWDRDGAAYCTASETTGWRPSCAHTGEPSQPCTVLDPFFGAGTTGLVADRLNRNCIGIEINPTYADMARRRISGDNPMFSTIEVVA